jgi:hypothetical protein
MATVPLDYSAPPEGRDELTWPHWLRAPMCLSPRWRDTWGALVRARPVETWRSVDALLVREACAAWALLRTAEGVALSVGMASCMRNHTQALRSFLGLLVALRVIPNGPR